MLHERADFVACVVGDDIYVVGGRNRFGAISRCEKYDCRLNEWTPIMNLPQGIYMASGVSLNGCIYVAGGFNDCEALGSMMRYSTITNSWEEMVSPMMVDRGYHVMIQGPDEKLWVVGGVDNPFAGRNVWEIEAFDTTSNNWLFLGQVLPVQPFLSTLRLNVCKNDRNHICVFSVSKPLAYPSVAYDDTERMWYQMRNYADFPNIAIDGCVIK
uniref:BACK domain-containing protein n=1 Tax=Ciona savignyi TaxID=51511 RepID=H2YSD3_CIOSA